MARKKLLLLVLSLAVVAGSLAAPRVQAADDNLGGGSCTLCSTNPDGLRCCSNCQCDASGTPISCTDVIWCYRVD
ncbi:MAG TPA: hypothetical protein VF173_10420 [Thermoanaerobaculia bacterium]|nr:hypothetical protein [Thermoanaerobaculia bacterium]